MCQEYLILYLEYVIVNLITCKYVVKLFWPCSFCVPINFSNTSNRNFLLFDILDKLLDFSSYIKLKIFRKYGIMNKYRKIVLSTKFSYFIDLAFLLYNDKVSAYSSAKIIQTNIWRAEYISLINIFCKKCFRMSFWPLFET